MPLTYDTLPSARRSKFRASSRASNIFFALAADDSNAVGARRNGFQGPQPYHPPCCSKRTALADPTILMLAIYTYLSVYPFICMCACIGTFLYTASYVLKPGYSIHFCSKVADRSDNWWGPKNDRNTARTITWIGTAEGAPHFWPSSSKGTCCFSTAFHLDLRPSNATSCLHTLVL